MAKMAFRFSRAYVNSVDRDKITEKSGKYITPTKFSFVPNQELWQQYLQLTVILILNG